MNNINKTDEQLNSLTDIRVLGKFITEETGKLQLAVFEGNMKQAQASYEAIGRWSQQIAEYHAEFGAIVSE